VPTPQPITVWASGGAGGEIDYTFEIPVEVNANTGEVTLALSEGVLQMLMEDALAMAKELNEDAEEDEELVAPTITFNLTDIEGATSLTLDMALVESLASAEIALLVILPDAEVILTPEALAMLVEAAADAPIAAITIEAAQDEGGEMIFYVGVFMGVDMMDVPMTIRLPYSLGLDEDPDAVRVWRMDDGDILTCMNGVYDPDAGMMTFTTSYHGYFLVAMDAAAA